MSKAREEAIKRSQMMEEMGMSWGTRFLLKLHGKIMGWFLMPMAKRKVVVVTIRRAYTMNETSDTENEAEVESVDYIDANIKPNMKAFETVIYAMAKSAVLDGIWHDVTRENMLQVVNDFWDHVDVARALGRIP